MVRYYYDKYNAALVQTFTEPPLTLYNEYSANTFVTLYKAAYWNSSSGTYTLGGGQWSTYDDVKMGDRGYSLDSVDLNVYEAKNNSVAYTSTDTKTYRRKLANATSNSYYTQGSLVQSKIVAEDGTYPANGRHSDGFWYVKGAAVNTAPTQPGAFTQPSGSLEIGDSKVFSVGASSDDNGNLSKYIWEVSINGAAYSKVGETISPSFTYTIPTATSLRMRVKAVDTGGLESAYRESSSYTVSKPLYYWNKYYLGRQYSAESTWNWEVWTSGSVMASNEYTTLYPSYKIFNDKFQETGSDFSWNTNPTPGFRVYESGNKLWKFEKDVPSKHAVYNSYSIYQITIDKLPYTDVAGSLYQTGISALEGYYPTNGKHSDGFWYVRGSRVNQSIAPPAPFTPPVQGEKFKPNESVSIVFGASTAPNLSLYEVDYRYNSTGAWTPLAYNNTLTRSFTITIDKTLKTLELRVRAKNTSNVYSDYVYSEPFEIVHNVAPTVSLTGPSDNSTLYETDTLNIAGTAHDADADQSVTVFYQLNSEQRKVLATNISQTQIALSKQLTFKGGKLYDGDTALTGTLADGVAHTLKVWAEDSEKASSANVERTFYVVPNRAPLLSVDAVVPSGIVDADKFKISGTASDQDANSTVKVTCRINTGNAIEIYSGTGGAWEFELALSQLVVGQNTIVIEVVDNYGAKASKTVTLNKKEVKTPILQSVARYKIEPPKGSAKGVLLFIQRDEELDVKVELSMTLSGEQEQYEKLTPVNTAPVQQGVVEDTFEHEGLEAKENIILKITPSQTDLSFNHKIHLISGAVD